MQSDDAILDGLGEEFPELVCPITQLVMRDPWSFPDGQNYERHAIEQWLATHGTSPVTRARMKFADGHRNNQFKLLIDRLLAERKAGAAAGPRQVCRPPKKQPDIGLSVQKWGALVDADCISALGGPVRPQTLLVRCRRLPDGLVLQDRKQSITAVMAPGVIPPESGTIVRINRYDVLVKSPTERVVVVKALELVHGPASIAGVARAERAQMQAVWQQIMHGAHL